MGVLKIILGLLSLGILILVHEFGHFIAARIFGLKVLTFSIGFGKKLLSIQGKRTEFAISLIPLGGYCKFAGEQNLIQAWEKKLDHVPRAEGELFSIKPWKRILVALAGPMANIILALIMVILAQTISYTEIGKSPQILIASHYDSSKIWPSDRAGLQNGDLILHVNNEKIHTFEDVEEWIWKNAEEELLIEVRRLDGSEEILTAIPDLNKEYGIGQLGILPYSSNTLVKDFVFSDGLIPASHQILSIDGNDIQFLTDLYYQKNSEVSQHELVVLDPQGESYIFYIQQEELQSIPLPFPMVTIEYSGDDFFPAFKNGWDLNLQNWALTFKGLGVLFRGINLSNALMGPMRIPVVVGEVGVSALEVSFLEGLRQLLLLLAQLSIALAFINLMPIPALDGGQMVLFTIDGIKKGSLKPNFIFNYQLFGSVMVLSLMILFISFDLMHLFRSGI